MRPSPWKVFGALVRRDVHVVSRELPFFLLRTTLQPIMFTVVFGYLLPKMGFVNQGYTAALLPGILGVSLAFASVQAVALPMVADFGWTGRSGPPAGPVPTWVIALGEGPGLGHREGVIAARFVLPGGHGSSWGRSRARLRPLRDGDAMTLLGAFALSAFGLVLGTGIKGEQIGLMFGLSWRR